MKKLLCLFLIFAMVLGIFSTGTMATGADTVYLSVSYDGQYGTDKNGKPMAYVPVSMSALSAIDLAEYGLGDFLYDADGDGTYDTTALHLYIYAHETLMGLSWNDVRVSGYPGAIYFEDGLFGYTCNMQYYLNGTYPEVDGWGLTVDQIVLNPGDFLDVAAFTSWSFFSDSGFGFHYFLDSGTITHAYAATAGEPCTVTLGRAASFMGGGNMLTEIANYTVSYGTTLGTATGTVTTEANGQATVTFPTVGTYYLWADGTYGVENPLDIVSAPGCAVVTVEAAPQPVTYTVSLPEGEGFTAIAADGSASPVVEGGSYSFTVAIAEGYQEGEDFAVTANDVVLVEADGVYTLTEISENQQVSVCGVEIVPQPEPEPQPEKNWQEVMTLTEAYLTTQAQMQAPVVSSTGGEWMVLGLARNGKAADTDFLASYYETAKTYVQANIDAKGRLHNSKSTENARVILALTALGKDVTNVGGHNLLQGLSDTSYVKKQGINGPIWALIALDSRNYEIPVNADAEKQVTRQWLVAEILQAQLPDGGWKIMGETADDMTAMAVQALAPYYAEPAVKEAVDKALAAMEELEETGTPETFAQIIVARSTLGLDSSTAMEKLLTFALEDGSFRKSLGTGANQMSTEQAFYAMVAYSRFRNEKPALYHMSDVVMEEPAPEPEPEPTPTPDPTPTPTPTPEFGLMPEEIAGYATVSFEDRGVRRSSELSSMDAKFSTPLGTIVPATSVPFKAGDTVASVTLRLLHEKGITARYEGSERAGFYLEAIGNFTVGGKQYTSFGEFDAGVDSGWMITQNGWFIDQGASQFAVQNGDIISWKYTCQRGRDIGDTEGAVSGDSVTEETPKEEEKPKEEISVTFADVTESDYYYDAVKWAVEQNITAGTGETSFSPDAVCTRAQLVTFLWRAAGCPETAADSVFDDVDPAAYWYKAMLWAVEQGITTGTTKTTFSPDAVCTRGQMAAFLYRSAKSPAFSGENNFGDVSDTAYYGDAVKWAAEQGITTGTTETTFSPDAHCTRAQMVTFLYRHLGNNDK